MALPLLLALGACAPGPPPEGLAPTAMPARSRSADAAGRFEGVALGWSLGGEVHLYVADSAFSRQVFERLIRPRLLHDAAPPDSAFAQRDVLSLDADSLPRLARDSIDATILAETGAVPAQLSLVRLHAPGVCAAGGPVTELVYRLRPEDLAYGPRAHTPVVGLLRATSSRPVAATFPPAPTAARAQTLLIVTALAASRVTTELAAPGEGLLALPTLDAEREDDAGEVLALAVAPGVESRVAVAVRARFGIGADTSRVSGVALTDGAQTVRGWVLAPIRARGGSSAGALRYVLRGRVADPPGGTLLLVDRIDDVRPGDSRVLVVDPAHGRLLTTQPLALNCGDR